jgi:hypothetical protein
LASSEKLRVTVKPHSSMMASLASAVSAPPEMIAPGVAHALAGRRGDAGDEADDGLLHVRLAQRAASASSGPPISPIMMTASVSGSSLNSLQHVDVLQAVDRVAADADSRRLAEAEFSQLPDGFIGERARARHHADAALAMDVTGHDADLDFVGRDDAGAVRAQQQVVRPPAASASCRALRSCRAPECPR